MYNVRGNAAPMFEALGGKVNRQCQAYARKTTTLHGNRVETIGSLSRQYTTLETLTCRLSCAHKRDRMFCSLVVQSFLQWNSPVARSKADQAPPTTHFQAVSYVLSYSPTFFGDPWRCHSVPEAVALHSEQA